MEVVGPELLEYRYKVSSEDGFDFLTVSLDGFEQDAFSGEIEWALGGLSIPSGAHTVTFSYAKDGSVDAGDDSAWLDTLTFASATGRPVIVSPSIVILDAGGEFSYLIESIAVGATFAASGLPSGLVFDGDQTVSGSIGTPGDYSFQVRANANGQEDIVTVAIRVSSPVGESVEFDTLPWTREGESIWFGQTVETFDGIDAAQSGDIGDSESCTMSITVTGPDQINFQWKVSSEEGFDQLEFLLDGQIPASVVPVSGEQDWESVNFVVPSGTHTLSWRYAKDGSASEGTDAAWLDDIRLASGRRPMIVSDRARTVPTGMPTRIPVDFINVESYSFQNLPAWLMHQSATDELVGVPPAIGVVDVIITAVGVEESIARSIRITTVDPAPTLSGLLGQSGLTTVSLGDALWFGDSTTSPEVARSGVIADDESSEMTLFIQGPGTLGFEWMVSSEAGFDFLVCSVNGVLEEKISGDLDWEGVEVSLKPGMNQVTWVYEKDGSAFAFEDLGRVRAVALDGFAGFLSGTGVDHYNTRPEDDPEGNGLSLLHEYAFLVSPGGGRNLSPLTITLSGDSSGQALLEFEGLGSAGGVDYHLEWVSDLSTRNWQRINESLEVTPSGVSSTYRHLTPLPDGNESRRFFRVGARFR